MKPLACAVLVCFAAPVCAADKDADKAKEVTLAFLKAAKAKDLDALMKTVDVPFYMDGAGQEPVTKLDDLKAKFKPLLEKVKADEVPTDVGKVLDLAAIRKEAEKAKDKEKTLAEIEKAIGKDGFVVTFLKDGQEDGAVLVRIKDGQAKIVGMPK